MYILWKFVYVEWLNCVNYFKFCVYWIYKIVHIFWKIIYIFIIIGNSSFIDKKVQCVYDSKLIALKMNTNKSKGRANINKEINRLTSLSTFSNVW